MTVAVHAGVWGDFRRMDPKNFIPEIERHPSLRIDLFHLGMPMVRDAVMVGKNFPNVSLNLCWSHVVSQRMARHGLDEALDLVPINKIIAFGADYRVVVEKAVGHLIMARENVAAVLAGRVEDGEMDEATAVGIARRWFYDNPKRIYRL
jgi:predicted TIM-barrel fold metal-dependent hydrolase